jgi:hypothetical protein
LIALRSARIESRFKIPEARRNEADQPPPSKNLLFLAGCLMWGILFMMRPQQRGFPSSIHLRDEFWQEAIGGSVFLALLSEVFT